VFLYELNSVLGIGFENQDQSSVCIFIW